MKFSRQIFNAKTQRGKGAKKILLFLTLLFGGFILWQFAPLLTRGFLPFSPEKVSAEEFQTEIEKAIFTRQEFFGTEAIVPLPTAEARENLAKLAANQPDNPQILERLAEFDEKLEKFDEAEKGLIRLAEVDSSKLDKLANFYHARAKFEKEAEILEKILFTIEAGKRAGILQRLIDLARIHDLKKYLENDFLNRVTQANPDSYEIFEKLIAKFEEEKNYDEALKVVRQARANFPAKQGVLLDKEVEILLNTNQAKEAEKVYQAAFNPFWSNEETTKFYEFLSGQDRLRLYGGEIKAKFRQNPADFDTAIRLAHYQNHDYEYGNDDISPIILKLEKAKKSWTTEELVTLTRLLLQTDGNELASRFLYTLFLREDFKQNKEIRGKVLYQLFEMFSDADEQKLPLTKGDLSFYQDIAKADSSPGISTGILSLIFSDSNPNRKLAEQETKANKYFNRAAAYRIFTEYKAEFPTSPELAQMYLDIVRLYTATKEIEIAEKFLNEFAERFEKSDDYAAVALKLADAFAAVNKSEKQSEIYQKTLDYLGKNQQPKPAKGEIIENDGIKIPNEVERPKDEYFYEEEANKFRDYLGRKTPEISYGDVLERYTTLLEKDKKTAEILATYSNEINKYPDAEWLYEKRLAWLEQTNLVDEQLKAHQAALNRFQTNNWRDKLARWFLRQNRNAEFAEFSSDLVGKLKDEEVQNYLSQFVSEKSSANQFERELFLKLYQTAHQRFPHNLNFVNSLLRFYKSEKQETEWRKLSAEYFFVSKEIREEFLNHLAEKGELREYLAKSTGENIVYQLFTADASVRLSNYESAIASYRKLNQIYPHTPEFSERLLNFTRSFGQRNRPFLSEAADIAQSNADFEPSSAQARTHNGEIQAELGNYKQAREEWEKLLATGAGDKETYLETATLYWDYFQYQDALQTIQKLRNKFDDETLYAFETGAILEAQNQQNQAISEYVKALGDGEQKEKAKKRLATLTTKNPHILPNINSAFAIEKSRRKDASFLSLGYAEFLHKIEQTDKAESVLNSAISNSQDSDFLEEAQEFYQSNENPAGEQIVLRRLAEISENPRQKISNRLLLAESLEENKQRDKAKKELDFLVRNYPTNFGVVTETSDFYWRLGFENESVSVLNNALLKSKGKFQNRIAQKLSKRLIQQNKLEPAEQMLVKLHAENRENTYILNDLAQLCVRTGNAELMRKTFDETILAIKQTDQDRREIDWQVAELRLPMIDAFTRLKDYKSAVEQHIEIINREPDEANTENAIRYVQRYGGAETLLDYYQKLSTEAFKNYRWNVVLARLYEANKDSENAVKNYKTAIVNQPEMPELYLAIAEIETRRNNFDAAVQNMDEVLTLTNDEAKYVKKKIEVLKKAGRIAEIEAEKAKLPPEPEKKVETDEFAEARKLAFEEKEKARQIYREAFAKLLENPLSGELKTADLTGYANSVREEESLANINQNFWNLREKLIEIADETDGKNSGEARTRLGILDSAMVESIGTIAKNFGTEEELTALHEDLKNRLEKSINDRQQTVSLIQDVSRRAGFGDLEELILQKKLENVSDSDKPIHLQNLVNFYNERGAYQKTFEALEKYGSDNLPLKAETARLVGNREKELEALRQIYWKPLDKIAVETDANVTRYLTILHAENREELKSLTEKSSSFQLQLINFLLSNGERELAHKSIENSSFSTAWKVSRNAETSLALKEFDDDAECYFCEALQIDSIGNLLTQTPDKRKFLINDDWFRLSRGYGGWLFEQKDKEILSSKYLVAMVENQPKNADQQFKLGEFYLQKNEFLKAIEHFQLAIEVENLAVDDSKKLAKLGVAFYLSGKKDLAEETWASISADENFLQTLQRYGLAEKGREKLLPNIVSFLKIQNVDENSEEMQKLVRAVANSFTDEDAKAKYFQAVLRQRPTDTSLAEMLLNESLILPKHGDFFYRRLIAESKVLDYSDYDYQSVSERIFDRDDAESVYEQEHQYEAEEPESKRLEWQKKYLEMLLERDANAEAKQLIAETEKGLNGRFIRPDWLRLAKLNLQIREENLNLAEAKRFIGITVSDSATEILPPSLERLNEVLRIVNESQKAQLSEAFFARMLALEQFDAANFVGLSRTFFQKGEAEKGLQILRLVVEASDENRRETALAEISALESVKSQTAKIAENEGNVSLTLTETLKLAAETAFEFKQISTAIEFRQTLQQISTDNKANQIELAKLLSENNQKTESIQILHEIIADKNSLRPMRWQARILLRELSETVDLPNVNFDAFSQFYQANNESVREFLINALIADKDAETVARQELIKNYAKENLPFAALKLAETDKSAKSDDLLQILSEVAEKVGDFARAIEFEKAKSKQNEAQIIRLQKLADEQTKRATDFTVNTENTRKL